MKVAKFGGTSLASAEQIRKVCDIVLSDPDRRVMVVSAPGKRTKEDTKVTDLLIACAEKALAGGNAVDEIEAVVSRFSEIAEELQVPGDIAGIVREDLKKRVNSMEDLRNRKPDIFSDMFMDLMKAAGEDNSAKVVAAYLKSRGHAAEYVNPGDAGLMLSDEFGNARVLTESFEALHRLRKHEGIVVFPGFFGYSKEGDVVTFSRGGSDITGSILAAATNADVYENFTDVDAVFVANPNIVKDPRGISEITYREMRELSYAGFSVLHEETLEPVYRKGIPVNIRNTNNPKAPGTMILKNRGKSSSMPVVGIAGDDGFCSLYVGKYMMNREVGFGRKLLNILEDEGISYEHCPSGIDDLSVIMREKYFTPETETKVTTRIRDELGADDISVERSLGMVMVVGEGMMRTVGVAVRACGALSHAGINIEMINQGSSEVSMMFGIRSDDVKKAVQALYKEYFG